MRFWKSVVMVGMAALFLAGPAIAYFDDCDSYSGEVGCTNAPGYYDGYDDSQSHPLQIAAYALNPVGYAVEWLVARPIHALVSQPELQSIFGYKSRRWDFCCGMPQASAPVTAPPPPIASTADVDAARRAAEEARAAAEEAKRAAEEAARAAEKSTQGFEKTLRK